MDLQLVPYVQDLRQRDPATGLLVLPASVSILLAGSLTYAPLYTDISGTLSLTNPLPIGVAPPTNLTGTLAGVDTAGNAGFWIEPGRYDLLVDGSRFPVVIGMHPDDITTQINSVLARTASDIPVDTSSGAQGPNVQAAIDALVAAGGSGDVLID